MSYVPASAQHHSLTKPATFSTPETQSCPTTCLKSQQVVRHRAQIQTQAVWLPHFVLCTSLFCFLRNKKKQKPRTILSISYRHLNLYTDAQEKKKSLARLHAKVAGYLGTRVTAA